MILFLHKVSHFQDKVQRISLQHATYLWREKKAEQKHNEKLAKSTKYCICHTNLNIRYKFV